MFRFQDGSGDLLVESLLVGKKPIITLSTQRQLARFLDDGLTV